MFIVWMYDVPLEEIFSDESNGIPFTAHNLTELRDLVYLAMAQGHTVAIERIDGGE